MPLDGQTFVLPALSFDERVRQKLLCAAARIERHGWCQDRVQDEYGRMCVLGALMPRVGEQREAFDEARERLRAVIKRDSIVDWNNKKGRTQTEVVSALRRAAEI